MELLSSQKLEAVAGFLSGIDIDGQTPCQRFNDFLKRDRVNVPCDDGDCDGDCPFYSTANFVKWIKEPDRKVDVEGLKKPKQMDFFGYDNRSNSLLDKDGYIRALEKYCNDLENVLADTEYDLEEAECENRELQDTIEKIREVIA